MKTYETSTSSPLKRFGTGLLGGLIGGAVAFGLLFNFNQGSDKTSQPLNNHGEATKVEKVAYDVENNTSKAVEKVQGAVVSVINLQKRQEMADEYGLGGLFGLPQQPEKKSENNQDELETSSEGSGVIYKKDGKNAYVVTNNHVVEGSDALEVLMNDGSKVSAELVGADAYTDLAVLKISAEGVKDTAEFGDSDVLKIGEPAIAIGSPLGSDYANSVTQGIISAKNRTITNQNPETGQPTNINAIQTDAAINPGNSGGPLINIAGQVIGINSIKIARAASGISAEGMGFSIPSNDVVDIINQLEQNGQVIRPMLGVMMIDLAVISQEQQEKILKLPTDIKSGVIIRSVQAASPAEAAGLKQYDVIVGIDGKEIENATDLQTILYTKKVGDEIEVTYYREHHKNTVKVSLSLDRSSLEKE